MRLLEVHPAVGEHVAEIVQGRRVVGRDVEQFAKLGLGLLEALGAFVHRAVGEQDGDSRLFGIGQLAGAVDLLFGLVELATLLVDPGHRQGCVDLSQAAVVHPLDHLDRFLSLAAIGEGGRQQVGQHGIILELARGAARFLFGAGEVPAPEPGLDDLCQDPRLQIRVEGRDLAEGLDRRCGLVLLALQYPQAFQQHQAPPVLVGGIFVPARRIQEFCQLRYGLLLAAFGLQQVDCGELHL